MPKTLRLILGDQLNPKHSWYSRLDSNHIYVLMEVSSESDYVKHHVQKILGFFSAMRRFAERLRNDGHEVIYLKISDKANQQNFKKNLILLIEKHEIEEWQYQEPDEYRLDQILQNCKAEFEIPCMIFETEHFLTKRNELSDFFGKKKFLLESFYRHMRKKFQILMENDQPLGGQWNFDQSNRKKIPAGKSIPEAYTFDHDLSDIYEEIQEAKLPHFGNVNPEHFIWPLDREEGLEILDHFIQNLLEDFGPFQDAMTEKSWSIFHSRISFALNLKMISPLEVIQKVEAALEKDNLKNISSVEGFIRQVLGWGEYMRGVYWAKMPDYAEKNFFNFVAPLPESYWTGETKMQCISHSVKQSLDYSYAHHIQRLMITGNFALLMQCDPDAVDQWYLGVYIDAIEWVQITNTRGMSQYADGGLLSSKPYISSANYINKMSAYCKNCHYDFRKKTGDKACPFNSLYWHFLDSQKDKLASNPRMGMMYNLLDKMDENELKDINTQALNYLENRNVL